MNFNQNYFPSPMSPLSINLYADSVNQNNQSIWSPFSTPSFSPFDNSQVSSFQYSNFYSPNPSVRAISKDSRGFNNGYHHQNSNFLSNSITSSINKINASPMFHHGNQQRQNKNPSTPKQQLPKRSDQIDMNEFIKQAAMQRAMGGRLKLCTFCKTNGESEQIFTSHSLKDSNDKITCPILMRYSCPVCGATGEQTHTKKYCPVLQKKLRMDMLKNITNNSKQ